MVTLDDIVRARAAIAPHVHPTPLEHSPALSRWAGAEVHLKLENLRETRAFKIRGACNFLAQMPPEARRAGVVAASGGSHAQGVAYAARRFGVPATIVMTERAPANLARICRDYGAEVLIHGQVYDDALQKAREVGGETGRTLIHSYDDPHVVAGQGTIALEILEALPQVDAIVAPVGGGGLLGGVGVAVKALKPDVRVIGVEPAQAPAMRESLRQGRLVRLDDPRSLADKLVVRSVGELNLDLARRFADDVLLVEEEEIAEAVFAFLDRANLLVEGAAAAALAAARRSPALAGRRVALVVTGGNIDARVLAGIIERCAPAAGGGPAVRA